VVSYRYFCNKLWQAFRLALSFLSSPSTSTSSSIPSAMDRWILSRYLFPLPYIFSFYYFLHRNLVFPLLPLLLIYQHFHLHILILLLLLLLD